MPLKDPLGSTERIGYSVSPGLLSQVDITKNVYGRALKPDSVNESINSQSISQSINGNIIAIAKCCTLPNG